MVGYMDCIGIVGFGRMGSAAAESYINAGYKVYGWNRSLEKVDKVYGVEKITRLKDLPSKCSLIMVFVSDDDASAQVLYGKDGLFSGSSSDTVILNASTISPIHSKLAYDISHELNINYLHTPIMGGPKTLVEMRSLILVDGDKNLFKLVEGDLKIISRERLYLGPPPTASVVKLILNSIAFTNAEILSEVISLAEAWDVNLDKLYEAASKTWLKCIFDKYMRRILSEDYPSSFRMRLAAKDLFYTTASGYYKDIHMPIISMVSQLYLHASSLGYSEDDYSRIFKIFKRK